MSLIHKFKHEDKDYEIRATQNGDRVFVAAYQANQRVNKYSYSIDFETAYDFEKVIGTPAIKELSQIAQSDVINPPIIG